MALKHFLSLSARSGEAKNADKIELKIRFAANRLPVAAGVIYLQIGIIDNFDDVGLAVTGS